MGGWRNIECEKGLKKPKASKDADVALAAAAKAGWAGRFQFEAAIQWVHAQRAATGQTDREAIALLYEGLAWVRALITFAKGAALPDPHKLFNSSLDGNVRRAIDIHEGETLNAAAFKALILAAAAHNFNANAKPRVRKPQ